MHGLAVMLHVGTQIHIKNIDKIKKLEKERNKVKNITLQNNGRSKYNWQIDESVKLHCYKGLDYIAKTSHCSFYAIRNQRT